MHKETITYEDYNGIERTEEFLFNFSKAEIMEMQYGISGGLDAMLKKIVATKDMPGLITIFKDLVLKAYGQKSPDGRRFIKSQELRDDFESTPAYSIIFMKYATNDVAGAEFINNIIPADIAKELAKQEKKTVKAAK